MILNRFFLNNSGNPKPIWTKFYSVMTAQMGSFPGMDALGQGRSKSPSKKNELFVRETPKCHFSAADLREIWRQHANRSMS